MGPVGDPAAEDGAWASVSDLAEYAYCPRALWYRHHPPAGGPAPDSALDRSRGEQFHARRLSAVATRAEPARWPWALLALGAILVLVALALGGPL
jgi:hypothetical protein